MFTCSHLIETLAIFLENFVGRRDLLEIEKLENIKNHVYFIQSTIMIICVLYIICDVRYSMYCSTTLGNFQLIDPRMPQPCNKLVTILLEREKSSNENALIYVHIIPNQYTSIC